MLNMLDFSAGARRFVTTSFGRTALVDVGEGFPTVFLHGVGQSAFFWRNQLHAFRAQRRCLAIDLMAHGYTEAPAEADVSFKTQAGMIIEALDALDVAGFDLVINDSGGAIGQIIAVTVPDRVRSLAFSNCDVHDNWPSKTLNEIRSAATSGVFADQLGRYIDDPDAFADKIGVLIYENASFADADHLQTNFAPLVSSQVRKDQFNRYVGFQDHDQLVEIEDALRALDIPALIVWGDSDPFFPLEWAYWLHDALPKAHPVIELAGGKLFFPEERPEAFNAPLKAFWETLA